MSVDIKIIKLKVRRGTDSERRTVTLNQGEPGFTTDTHRLYVGDGITVGGISASTKVHPPLTLLTSLTSVIAERWDVCSVNGQLKQLTGSPYTALSAWQSIGTVPDGAYLEYNAYGTLSILDGSVDGVKLDQQALSSTSINFTSDTLNVNYNTSQFTISSGQLAINASGVNETHIASSSLSDGLTGGSGYPLKVHVDGNTLGFVAGALTVLNNPVSSLGYDNLNSGFNINYGTQKVNTNVIGVDSTTFALCAGNVTMIKTVSGANASAQELPMFDVTDTGLIIDYGSSIYDILSCDNTGGVSDIFNGSPDMVMQGYTPLNSSTVFNAISSGLTISLSSAGFIVFQGGSATRNNPNHKPGRFAIPVFAVPN